MPYKDKEKHREQIRVIDRRYRQNHKEKRNKQSEEWRNNHKAEIKEYEKSLKVKERREEYKKNNPEKIKARYMANNNLKHLKKEGFEMHHPDYSRPLLVEVLPIKIHRQLHLNNQVLIN